MILYETVSMKAIIDAAINCHHLETHSFSVFYNKQGGVQLVFPEGVRITSGACRVPVPVHNGNMLIHLQYYACSM